MESISNFSIPDVEHVFRLVQQSEIVSFDVFDTLLLRNVISPTDIFKAVEIEYKNQNNVSLDFYHNRIKAEQQARLNTDREDVNYDEIYNVLYELIGEPSLICKEIELELEHKFMIANRDMRAIYDYALRLGKTIYIISDMYLSSSAIEFLLVENGFDSYRQIFVSNEWDASKATGSLYKKIRETFDIHMDVKWLHIGDNKQSDIINAQINGLHAYYYKKLADREKVTSIEHLGDSIVRAIQLNNKYMNHHDNYWYNFGANVASSVYIGYMQWLVEQIEDEDHIYFLSRDGYFPFQLYKLLREHRPELPEGKYVYASRRAYIYPSLLMRKRDDAIEYLISYNIGSDQKITVSEILRNIGLEEIDYLSIIRSFQIDKVDETVTEKNTPHVKAFLTHIWFDIEAVLKKEYEALQLYFKQIGMLDKEYINIVDIGWSGSTQLAIKRLLNKRVVGYYFATTENIKEEIRQDSKAYAFHFGLPINLRQSVINNAMMYELLFSAPEGSLIRFDIDVNGEAQSILKKVEQNDDIYEVINFLQLGAFDLYKKIIEYSTYMEMGSSKVALHEFQQFINSQRVEDLIQFSKLTNSVGLGFTMDVKKYVNVVELEDYLENRNLIKQQSKYLLWRYAVLIKDNQGRWFNEHEIEAIYKLEQQQFRWKINALFNFTKKVLRNPKKVMKKAIKWIIALVKS